MLSEEECKQISKILKKTNRHIWTEPIILKVIEILNQLRKGQLNQADFFVDGLLTYENYLYNINLIQFANGNNINKTNNQNTNLQDQIPT